MGAAALIPAGLSLASGVVQGIGQSKANSFQSAQAKQAADIGRIRADDTTTQMRDELSKTIAGISAVRASAGVGASPTEWAIKDATRAQSQREEGIRVYNIRSQVAADENAARFYKSSAKLSLFGGALGGLTSSMPYWPKA